MEEARSSSPVADDPCPICMGQLEGEFARPESCQHRFHRTCIKEWAKLKCSCPACRIDFANVFVYLIQGEKRSLISTDQYTRPSSDELANEEMAVGMNMYDFTNCRICGGGDMEETILLCDECDEGFHMACLNPPLTEVPETSWFCNECVGPQMREERRRRDRELIRRTALSERVRSTIRRMNQANASSGEDSEGSTDSDSDDSMSSQAVSTMLQERLLNDDDGDFLNIELPSVSRRKRGSKKKSGGSGKRKKTKKSKKKRSHSSKRRESDGTEGESSHKRCRGQRARSPGLSITGAGMEYTVEDEPPSQEQSTSISVPAEVDECDLLGSIIPEQEKTLAPGKLFKVEGGKFKGTSEFQSYQKKLKRKMDDDISKRLTIQDEDCVNSSCSKIAGTATDTVEIAHTSSHYAKKRPSSEMSMDSSHSLDPEVQYEMNKVKEEHELRMKEEAARKWAAKEEQIVESRRQAQLKRDAERERLERERRRQRERSDADNRYRKDEHRSSRQKPPVSRQVDKSPKRDMHRDRRRDTERNSRSEKERKRSHSPKKSSSKGTGRERESPTKPLPGDRGTLRELIPVRSSGERNGVEKKSGSKSRSSGSKEGNKKDSSSSKPPDVSHQALDDATIHQMAQAQMMALNGQDLMQQHHPFYPALPHLGIGTLSAVDVQFLLAARHAQPSFIPPPLVPTAVSPTKPLPVSNEQQPVKPAKPVEVKERKSREKTTHDKIKIVDHYAKKEAKSFHTAGAITTEEYKDLMKSVVKACVKSDILEKSKIREKMQSAIKDVIGAKKASKD